MLWLNQNEVVGFIDSVVLIPFTMKRKVVFQWIESCWVKKLISFKIRNKGIKQRNFRE